MDRKFMIASDIHGSAYWCRKMLEAFEKSGADRLILLGDLLYHGPRNDLPQEYDTKAVASMLNSVKEHIFAVRGNCDAEVDQMVLDFPMMADSMILPVSGGIFATHGHIYNDTEPGKMPKLRENEALLHGHTHLPSAVKKQGPEFSYYFLNPGSVSIPKGGFANSYALLAENVFTILDFDSNCIGSIAIGE